MNKKNLLLAPSMIAILSLVFAGCGGKESYACQSKSAKEALKVAMEDEIINEMIHAKGLKFANRKVLENADSDELKAVYAQIKTEYQKVKFDILDIKTKKIDTASKTSECVASVSINALPSKDVNFLVRETADSKIELNISN